MLRENVKKLIKQKKTQRENASHYVKKPKEKDERVFNMRVRNAAEKGIQDLTFLLKNLPEDELGQVFTVENVKGFLDALLSFDSDEVQFAMKGMNENERKQFYERKITADFKKSHRVESGLIENRRSRIMSLWSEILTRGLTYKNVANLVGSKAIQAVNFNAANQNLLKAMQYAIWNSE